MSNARAQGVSRNETFSGDVESGGGDLRVQAERAWAERQKVEHEEAEGRADTEEKLLLAKLVELGAVPQSVNVTRAGARVSAETEGLRFASTYSDPTLRKLGFDDEPAEHGVVLLKRCPQCDRDQRSGVIRTPTELGRELGRLTVIPVHRCAAGEDGSTKSAA
ncbi:MAG: hypothetical protein LC802_10605 [Acidobacteria bacterium]|nr:hypothetical protein [Acidobacteriota bacterium]